jgi:amidase
VNIQEYTRLDGLALGELVRRREVAPNELAQLALAAAAAVNPILGAIIETYDDQLGTDDARGAPPAGPFAGVPFMLKDISCTERGRISEAGSRLLRGWRAPADSELMRRFRASGLINVGRTTTSEFACVAAVETAATGTTRNPWNPECGSAGSSGGSAAAVASGVVPLAHGTDGGGSIRIPASCCGLVGLKPSRGRVSQAPATPLPGELSVDFALTRSVRDAAALLDAVAGPAPGDPFILPSAGSCLNGLSTRRSLRIAFTSDHLWDGRTDPQVVSAVERIAVLCEEMGHAVTQARPQLDWRPYVDATLDIWCAMTAASVDWAASQTGRRPGPDTLEGHTRAWDERGRALSALDLIAALETLGSASREVGEFFTRFDVLLSATLPALPLRLGQYDPVQDLPATWYYRSPLGQLESTTSLFNCTGQPAVSLPLAESANGLPIGIHLAGQFGDERALLTLAASLEEALPWADRRPAIHAASTQNTISQTS